MTPARLIRPFALHRAGSDPICSGPTAVRQLSDWGANVIKIEAPTDLADSEQPGGPRHGPDFQNLHRNNAR
jgi:crotonobetainyl-CoA:carnitine CoA-transferase CaiB-like acyl-CoA transferase